MKLVVVDVLVFFEVFSSVGLSGARWGSMGLRLLFFNRPMDL